MKLTADSRGRLASMDLFPPNTSFSAERQADGSIRLIELVEKEVPTVRPTRRNGKLCWPSKFRPSRATIAAAIRADRDSR